MKPIIQIEHIEQWYNKGKDNEYYALRNITLEIERGDYVAFFGPSGCGKTTLLYAISGIDRVRTGKVIVDGKNIATLTSQELAQYRQTGIGIVFQQFNLISSLTVIENIALPMSFIGVDRAKGLELARVLLKRFNLEDQADRYPQELSGGQQQRVGIARALANNPPILIADEPMGNLDSVNAQNTLEILKELNEKDGRTIIMVTHEAWSLRDAKTIFHMNDGVVASTEHRDTSSKELTSQAGESSSKEGVSKDTQKEESKEGQDEQSVHTPTHAESVDMLTRILSNYFMRDHTFAEIQKFEELLGKRFRSEIDKQQFKELLGTSFENGGVGLWKRKAQRISAYVEELIEKQKDLSVAITQINENPELMIPDELRQLRTWITQEYVGTIPPHKADAMEELISDRIRQFITARQFLEVLHMPATQSGLEFPLHSAQRMSERLEIIIDGSEDYHPVRWCNS